jgi:anti-sigma factor ChrR (cupin superfamily)
VAAQQLVVTDLVARVRRGDFVFEPYFPGVEIHRLYGDETSGASAMLLRYAPGAHVDEHSHAAHEHIYVLSGEQADDRGVYGEGTLVVNAPGSRHSVWSDAGCVVLVIREQPVVFTKHDGR